MSFVLGLQLFGFIVMTCAALALIIVNSVKQIITHYFLARAAYTKSLAAMMAQDMSFGDVLAKVDEAVKKHKT